MNDRQARTIADLEIAIAAIERRNPGEALISVDHFLLYRLAPIQILVDDEWFVAQWPEVEPREDAGRLIFEHVEGRIRWHAQRAVT